MNKHFDCVYDWTQWYHSNYVANHHLWEKALVVIFTKKLYFFYNSMLGSNCKVMTLESHIGSMELQCGLCGVCKASLGSPTITASFCSVILPKFLSMGIRAFYHINNMGGDVGMTMFAQDYSKD